MRNLICLITLLLAHLREILNTYVHIISTEKYSLRDFPDVYDPRDAVMYLELSFYELNPHFCDPETVYIVPLEN